MATKIYISPSDQDENLYSYSKDGHTYNEMEVNEEIADYLEKALLRHKGVEVKRNTTHAISKAITASNAWDADFHIHLHTNACGDPSVMGTRIFYYTGNEVGFGMAQSIFNVLNALTIGESSFVTTNSTWNEILSTSATSIYIESGFHSCPLEAKWLVNNTKEVAEAICKGIVNYLGIAYVAEETPTEPVTEPDMLADNEGWSVQVGFYRVKQNALNMESKLKADGYPTYVKRVKR